MGDNQYHFPKDIHLPKNPLIEAWFEVRWALEEGEQSTPTDTGFPFALGLFYANVKEQYPHREQLVPAFVPEDVLPPYLIRFRFRPRPNTWPVLQLGHGIATVNFTKPYAWDDFKKQIIYLRENLLIAYQDYDLNAQHLVLRYRNAVPFDAAHNDLLQFLAEKLNTTINLPDYIPSRQALSSWPDEVNLNFSYHLPALEAKGALKIISGIREKPSVEKILIFELEMHTHKKQKDFWTDGAIFEQWLTSAHEILHEWFFALIDGTLQESYQQRK